MFGINREEIISTIEMITKWQLDIRTVTMGISLMDCVDSKARFTAERIYDKITKTASRLSEVCLDIESDFSIPIVNKRVSVTPIALVGAAFDEEGFLEIAKALDSAALELGIDFLGGYSALVQKGATRGDLALINSIPSALSQTKFLCSSVNLASSKAGINMDAVAKMGRVIKEAAEKTAENSGIACAKLVCFANAVEDNPFMAGAFHGTGEPDCVVNVGISGPGAIYEGMLKARGKSFDELAEEIKKSAFRVTRMGQLVALEASKRLEVPFGIVDLSLAPTPAFGDSVALVLEETGLESVGAPGTTAALAMLNDAVKKGGLMASSRVGGLSGAFIPVSEDAGMIKAVERGLLNIEKLEAMTAVCSVGLDMIALEGDTSAETISGIIADEAAIGVINNKTTAVRVIPVPGKKLGDSVSFGGLLGGAPIMAVNSAKNDKFVQRGGLIPAPLHSLKN